MKEYKFYGWENANVSPIKDKYKGVIENPRHLYDLLSEVWSKRTCAPRMRDGWSEDNKTHGQCSVTAFLAQDIFGGEVYGIPREGGNFHCFNVVGDCVFDLTSEQFKGEELSYVFSIIQSREKHFERSEKEFRYRILKRELDSYLIRRGDSNGQIYRKSRELTDFC